MHPLVMETAVHIHTDAPYLVYCIWDCHAPTDFFFINFLRRNITAVTPTITAQRPYYFSSSILLITIFRSSSSQLLAPGRESLESKPQRMAHETILVAVLANLLLQLQIVWTKVPSVIVFGDSTVDTGNNNQLATIAKSNFEPYGRDYYGGQPTGRFSNGRVVSDFIVEALGIKLTMPAYLDPAHNMTDMATGVCFASAGTGYDSATSDILSVIPLWKQLEYYKKYQEELKDYLGQEKAETVLREALYLISLGTNDFLENYYTVPGRSSEYTVEEYQIFLAGIAGDFIESLYGLGARKISLGGLPPMGCLPLERTRNFLFGGGCIEEYNNVAKEFNVEIQGLVSELNNELSGIQLLFSDPYDFLLQIIQNPESFGFTTAKQSCCGTGYFEMGYLCNTNNPFTCPDANEYVFWDSFHPTERTNGIVADHVVRTSLAGFLVP